MTFVDLAGYEPSDPSNSGTTKFISQSLNSLQRILISITTVDSVPSFRSSSLTRVLRKFFSVDCKIFLLATVRFSALSIRGNLNALKSVSMFTGMRRKQNSKNQNEYVHRRK